MTNWQDEAKRLRFQQGMSYGQIAQVINIPGITSDTVYQFLRKTPEYKEAHKRAPDEPTDILLPSGAVGIFGDTHFPFDHPNYLQFVKDTFDYYRVSQIVCTGDLVDHHAISHHQQEACAKGPYDELDMSIARAKEYAKVFPNVKMCEGNHDVRVRRQAATVGIGERFLKPFNELLELPDTWEVKEEFILDNVLYKHGINCLGKDGAINTAIQERMSTVIGHSHSFGGCKYSANKREIIFGLNVGCGIDIDAYAFAYGCNAKFRPTLGCGIVFNSGCAIFVPMGAKYFRGSKEVGA